MRLRFSRETLTASRNDCGRRDREHTGSTIPADRYFCALIPFIGHHLMMIETLPLPKIRRTA